MEVDVSFDFNNDTPIYLQIIEFIKSQIISKKYLPNQKLPSVREFSLMFEVNPNTIQKALAELEDMGLIYTERTNGKFVTDNQNLISSTKNQSIAEIISEFYDSMQKLGLNKNDVLKILNDKEDL